jgi:hypothetical protein
VVVGGVKRGRPAFLTAEQKRERERLRKARQRRERADQEWARLTNSARYIELEVLHWLDLLDFLVAAALLDEKDVENPPAIEDAVGDLLNQHLDELRAMDEAEKTGSQYRYRLICWGEGENYRPRHSGGGTVRFCIDLADAEVLEIDIEDTRRLRDRLERVLFRYYSNIEDLRRPDAYGIPWGSFNYGRGEKAFDEHKPKPAPDPIWTKSDIRTMSQRWKRISDTTKRMSMKEQLERRKRDEKMEKEAAPNPHPHCCVNPISTSALLRKSPRERRGEKIARHSYWRSSLLYSHWVQQRRTKLPQE